MLEIIEYVPGGRLAVDRSPFGFESREGFFSRGGIGGEHGHQVAAGIAFAGDFATHDLDAGDGFGGGAIERGEFGAERRRVEHLGVEHAGAMHVVRVDMSAGDDIAAVQLFDRVAGDFPIGGRRQRGSGGNDAGEFFAVSELAKTSRALAGADLAIGHGNRGAIDHPLLGSEIDEHFAGGGGGLADLRPHVGSGHAAEGAHVERGDRGIAHHQADGGDGGVQLFGGCLGERGAGVLADFHFAGVDGDGAVLGDVQPGADLFRHALVHAAPDAAAGFLGVTIVGNQNDDDAAADQGKEFAPRHACAPFLAAL